MRSTRRSERTGASAASSGPVANQVESSAIARRAVERRVSCVGADPPWHASGGTGLPRGAACVSVTYDRQQLRLPAQRQCRSSFATPVGVFEPSRVQLLSYRRYAVSTGGWLGRPRDTRWIASETLTGVRRFRKMPRSLPTAHPPNQRNVHCTLFVSKLLDWIRRNV